MPVLASKPLLGGEDIMAAGHGDGIFVVDYVHLHSPFMKRLAEALDEKKRKGTKISAIEAHFYGNGPVRKWSPVLDYGPHAVSAILELLSTCMFDVRDVESMSPGPGRETVRVRATAQDIPTILTVGNGSPEDRARVMVFFEDDSWAAYDEKWPAAAFATSDGATVRTDSHDPLKLLVQRFCSYVENPELPIAERACARVREDDASFRRDLELSSDVEDALNKILRAASSSR